MYRIHITVQARDNGDATPDPLMAIWQDYGDGIDEILADAMKRRKEEPWRFIGDECPCIATGIEGGKRQFSPNPTA